MKKKLIVSVCIVIFIIIVLVLVLSDGNSGDGYIGTWTDSNDKDNMIIINKNKSNQTCSIIFPDIKKKVISKKGLYTIKYYDLSKGKMEKTATYLNGEFDKRKKMLIFDRYDYSFLKNGYKIIDGNTLQKYTVNTKKDAELPLKKDYKIYRVEDKK
jgi:hypothetical protein